MVAGFLEECCNHDPDLMVSAPDFCLAFSAWHQQNRGETYSPPSNETIGKALAAMGDPKIAIGPKLRNNRCRFYPGLVLNDAGLSFHSSGYVNRSLEAKIANATPPTEDVNRPIPASWRDERAVKKMREPSAPAGKALFE